MSQLKYTKKVAGFLLIIASVFLLVACSTNKDVPYGDISNEAYLTVGSGENKIVITEKELYDEFRKQSSATLGLLIDKEIFKEELKTAEKLLSDEDLSDEDEKYLTRKEATEHFDKLVNEKLFGSNDLDFIKNLDSLRVQVAVEAFVDSIFMIDNNIDRTQLFNDILAIIENGAENYSEISILKDRNILLIAQRIFAKKLLLEEIVDEDSDNFIKDEHVLKFYKDNVRGRHDLDVFFFHFDSRSEATAAFMQLNLKIDARNNWYLIPDIRDAKVVEALKANDEAYAHVIDILENKLKIGIKDEYSEYDYERYYNEYRIDKNRDKGLEDRELTSEQVLDLFIELYNLVNDNKKIKLSDDNKIVFEDGTEFKVRYTYDELNDLNSTFRSYLYDSLSLDEDEKAYSNLRAVGQKRQYLAFKFAEVDKQKDLLHEEKDADNKDQWIEDLTDEDKKIIEDARLKLIDTKLTNNFVSAKVNEKLEDEDIQIFDSVIRTFFEHNETYKGKDKNKSGEVVATIGKKYNITVRQLFNEMEKAYGIRTSVNLATDKLLLKSTDYVITKDMEKEFKADFKSLINRFSQDEFAQFGFPASLGRSKFLLLFLGATNNEEAIEKAFVIPELRSLYSVDFENHYDNFYDKFQTLVSKQHELHKGIKVSHLLVYFDGVDGSPVSPKEYFEDLSEDRVNEIKEGIVKLFAGDEDFAGIFKMLDENNRFDSVVNDIVREFNSAARLPLNNSKFTDRWSEFKKLGLNLKFESIGTEISNVSNFLTNSSTLDSVFYNRALELEELLNEYKEDDIFPYVDFNPSNAVKPETEGSTELDVASLDEIMSDFGFHFIVVQKGSDISDKLSAKYLESSDTEKDYQITLNKGKDDEEVINIYNEDEVISKEQIEYFFKGKDGDKGAPMPKAVKDAFDKYFNPVYKRYTENQFMQSELFFKYLTNEGVNFANNDNNSLFETIREVNKRQFFDYLNKSEGLEFDANYDNLYGDWFTILEGK